MSADAFSVAHSMAVDALNGTDAQYCFLVGADFLAHVERPDADLTDDDAYGIVQLGIILIEAAAISGEPSARNCLILFRDEIEYLRAGQIGPARLTLASC
ncbi:hypothetical protein ASG11_09920 [Sphingomonas sp. Leaf357]|uniref:hypothetical protein n=1 Tax=Sphingomonas sp. Leaf357 TaxID=1736350 RepID=UPI0006F700D4|nr:hypothetical protein [Sphingomonas sp. Leaf357]KQS04527.1 hypothetical protein ASG11_09920 [Sphingomonas sp. Leaf357]